MDISHSGGTTITLAGTRTIQFNPANHGATGHISLYSRRQRSSKQIVNGPGEYEIGGVLIATVALALKEGERLAHAVDLDGVSVVLIDSAVSESHLRGLTALGRVDVLVVDTGQVPDARHIVAALSPRVVIPYGERAPELCNLLGVQEHQPVAKLTWTGAAKLPKAVLLKSPRRSRVA